MLESLVSIVVTVYNMEEYIGACIFSVINQTYKNIEIIVVNDGSTDRSLCIIQEYQKIDQRIKIINSNNQGISNARNLGIENINGYFVVFVDGDDICLPLMVESMYKAIETNNADICVCNVVRINKNKITTQAHQFDYTIDLKNLKKDEYIYNYILNNKHAYSVWNRMYKSNIILQNNIRFRDFNLVYPEDLFFNLEILLSIRYITWINQPLYIHILHKSGLTNSYRENILYRYLNGCYEFKRCLINRNCYKEMEPAFHYIVQIETLCALISLLRNNKVNFQQLFFSIKDLYKWEFVKEAFTYFFPLPFTKRIIRWSIRNEKKFLSSIIIFVFFKLNIEFI